MEQEVLLQHDNTGYINRPTKRFLESLNDIPQFKIFLDPL